MPKDIYLCPTCLTEHPEPVIVEDDMPQQNISRQTNPLPDVEVLTPFECEILYHNLKNSWLDRSFHFAEARNIVERLYRRSVGLSREKSND
jgi:hypothetical protein